MWPHPLHRKDTCQNVVKDVKPKGIDQNGSLLEYELQHKVNKKQISITLVWCRHQKLHNTRQTLLIAISMTHIIVNFFVGNVEPSLQLLRQGHKQLFLQQNHTRTRKNAINIIKLFQN